MSFELAQVPTQGRMYRDELDRCYAIGKSKSMMDDPLRRGEKKRQQSRSAAKSRRLTESEIFAQLIDTLPTIDQPTIYQMDRIGALRLALTLCRVRRVGERFFAFNNENAAKQLKFQPSYTKTKFGRAIVEEATTQASMDACIEGFLMAVNKVGQLLYVTPGAAESIGFTQIDLMGRYLRDYVHADDWRELRDHLCTVGSGKMQSDQQADIASKTFFRMKTALTPRGGRARKLTMAVYQPLQAYIIKPSVTSHGASFEGFDYDEGANTTAEMDEDIRLMHCIPFTLSSSRRSSSDMLPAITSRHDLDMRFRICDESLAHGLGFKNAKSFIGRSYYDLIHPDDVQYVVRDVREMYRKCHSRTGYYRLLNRLGESVWVMSEMLLLVQNIRGVSQKSVVCAHQILSESGNNMMDLPRIVLQQRLKPVKEFEIDDDEYGYTRTDNYVERCEDVKPKIEPLTPVQSSDGSSSCNQVVGRSPTGQSVQESPMGLTIDLSPLPVEQMINPAPITDPQMNQWAYEARLCPDAAFENSKALAPYIALDSQTLTPLEDPDMPGLLPTHWDHWLCGNPIPQGLEGPKAPIEKPEGSPSFIPGQSLLSTDILPLDFADIFGMDIEDTNQFSIDEAERAFSQFDPSKLDDSMGRHNLNTPVTHVDTSWVASSSDCTVPITDEPRMRRRASVTSTYKKYPEPEQRRSRMDGKTIEGFEKQFMGDSPRVGGHKSMDDAYFFNDDDASSSRPRSRSVHLKTAADVAQIDNITKELYRETQRFLA